MKIETKYDIGQEVWFMWENKAIMRKVSRVEVQKYIDGEQYEAYNVEYIEGDDYAISECTFELEDLFATKEELLNICRL